MTDFPILTYIILLPLIGAALIFIFVRKGRSAEAIAERARNVALLTTVATFVLSLVLYLDFDGSRSSYQFVEKIQWVQGYNISYYLGIDGISLFLILLTTLLMPICVITSWKAITVQVREFMIAFLLLESLVVGAFASLDLVLFYFFFEASLMPMFLIIGIWGGENRVYAAFKFFLYTLLGSVLFLLAIVYIYFQTGTTDIPAITQLVPNFTKEVQIFLWIAFFASFAVKVPMWPFHTWLPDAHVQAPTAGSVILAGVLLKLGGYGFLRFSLPMLPDASVHFAPFIFTLSVIAVVYTSLVALMQVDMKKLIAYSSVAHMGYVTIGIFSFTEQGVQGALFQMISHGLVSAALFLCVGVLYDRMHTKEIARYGGVVQVMPKFALLFMLFTMASIGLPSTSGFVGEFLVLLGAFLANTWVAMLAATGVVLGAAYMLWLYKRVVFGAPSAEISALPDLEQREWWMLLPVAALTMLFGIAPNIILKLSEASVANLLEHMR